MQIEISVEELRKRKIFVATPMYGGQCAGLYTKSSADLATIASKYGVDVRFFYLFNESLVTRARNYLVDEFLRSDYTHLMFIDSDIHFDPKDVLTLAAIDKDIIGAPYPKKTIAWERVAEGVNQGKYQDINDLERFTGDFVFNPVMTEGKQEIKLDEPAEVLEIGTGFMMVKREVFEKFSKAFPQFKYKPDHNRSEHFDGTRYIMSYFDTLIDNDMWLGEGNSNGTDRYLSEDYMFCQLCRKIGIPIHICPWMELGHVGSYIFNGTLRGIAELGVGTHDDYKVVAKRNIETSKTKKQKVASVKPSPHPALKRKK